MSEVSAASRNDGRIVVLAPSAQDGPVTAALLARAGFECAVAGDVAELCRMVDAGAAAVLVAEEALEPATSPRLIDLLRRQEPWSDLPVIIFTSHTPAPGGRLTTSESIAPFGNVTLLERPVEVITLLSAVRAALRARKRQYAAREALATAERLQEDLRESDRRKTEFLGMLSHELRNPLAAARNSAYLLARAPAGSEQALRARQVIERQTEHLARLVDDLLDVTRISRGKIELHRDRFDAREVALRACEDHRALFEAGGIELRTETSGPVWIDADATRIAQVLGNLLQNAAKFSRPGGRVWVSVAAARASAEIRVRDQGVGIASDLVSRLFAPFVQGEGGLSRTRGGLGLGLALVKGLVELHGGRVEARSEGPDRGAEVVVTLPLAEAPAAAPAPPRIRRAPRSALVLVIEDNPDAARALADVLELQGHRVSVATDGRSGLTRARELVPDVILCDLGLPDMDGYQVARALRREGPLCSTRLVALSGYAQLEDRERSREAGFDAHLAKPANTDELSRAIERGVARGSR